MTARRYDPLTQTLHWATLAAVLAAYGLALYRGAVPKGDFRTFVTMLHGSFGVLVMGLTLARIGWRSVSPTPPSNLDSTSMKLAAKAGHLALYATLVAVPLAGILMLWAKGRGVVVFDLVTIPAPFPANKGLAKALEEGHEIAGHAMMALAGLHAVVAILHQSALKDGTMARMLPFGTLSAPKVSA